MMRGCLTFLCKEGESQTQVEGKGEGESYPHYLVLTGLDRVVGISLNRWALNSSPMILGRVLGRNHLQYDSFSIGVLNHVLQYR